MYIIIYDFGTSSVKTCLFDISKTIRLISGNSANYSLYTSDDGGVEQDTDEWLRHRIRAIYWKQWKKVRTKIRKLRSLNLPEWVVFELANSRKGVWRSAIALNRALTNKEIANLGYMSLTGYYLQVCEN